VRFIGAGGGRACGERPAATEDHQPAKALFDRKEWPEGYVFPACEPCNKATKHAMSVLVRLAPEREDDPQRVADFRKYVEPCTAVRDAATQATDQARAARYFRSVQLPIWF